MQVQSGFNGPSDRTPFLATLNAALSLRSTGKSTLNVGAQIQQNTWNRPEIKLEMADEEHTTDFKRRTQRSIN